MNTTRVIRIDSPICKHLEERDPLLGRAMHLIGDFQYSAHPNTEDFFFSTIIGQMMSNRVADIIEQRVQLLCGGYMTADSIYALSLDDIRSVGVSAQKAAYMKGFAAHIRDNPNFLINLSGKPNEEIIRELTSLKGIGNWTAKMYLLFVLNRDDILPYEDGAFIQSYRWLYQTDDIQPVSIKQRCAIWSPYKSVASRFMYRILDCGYTKYPSIDDAEHFLRSK